MTETATPKQPNKTYQHSAQRSGAVGWETTAAMQNSRRLSPPASKIRTSRRQSFRDRFFIPPSLRSNPPLARWAGQTLTLHRSKAGLGDWFRRLKSKLGTITAAANKLASVLWAMARHRRPYNPNRLGNPELVRAKKERSLRRQAEQLGFALTPVGGEVS